MNSFNTGRLYQINGQIIEWEIVDGWVKFYDRSRMINGTFRVPEPFSLGNGFVHNTEVTDDYVLLRYDRGFYKNI